MSRLELAKLRRPGQHPAGKLSPGGFARRRAGWPAPARAPRAIGALQLAWRRLLSAVGSASRARKAGVGALVLLAASGCDALGPKAPAAEPSGDLPPRQFQLDPLRAASDAIVELDLERARELLGGLRGAVVALADRERLAIERTKLALYAGDCDAAAAIVAALPVEVPGVAPLASVAERCSAAVAGAQIVEDEKAGIWMRFQDAADLPLAPFVAEVASRARAGVENDLGLYLPRPMRIDVVRDLFSLSAVSGLPVEAAETTGTVAVARWGRITFLSPSASPTGFPWEDTMAHELVHLMLSRATHDYAPLWLQEGVAKREELRWRAARPLDDPLEFDRTALDALLSGDSVGVDQLGPSIAMLPSARAASIAFAEVSSFIDFWIRENGSAALRLFLADLSGLRDRNADSALRSVTGASLSDWIERWQLDLLARADGLQPGADHHRDLPMAQLSRAVRLGDLLLERGRPEAAARWFDRGVEAAPRLQGMRARAAKAQLQAGLQQAAAARLGDLAELEQADADWFALHGRLHTGLSDAERDAAFGVALGLDPWSVLVACRGRLADPGAGQSGAWGELCRAARARPRPR